MTENLSLFAQLIIDRTKALVAIQELHKPYQPTSATAVYCAHCFENGGYDGALYVLYPCPTRRIADQGLGDNLTRTTKNGDNND